MSAEVWCLCGSMRFFDDMLTVAKQETNAGRIVLMPYSVITPENQGSDLKAMLDRLHREKIDLSQGIIVVSRGGYIGESTRGEIDHAKKTSKAVRYVDFPGYPDVSGGGVPYPVADPERVEWNPAGYTWHPAEVIERRNDDRLVIRLDDNREELLVEKRHCRQIRTAGEVQ